MACVLPALFVRFVLDNAERRAKIAPIAVALAPRGGQVRARQRALTWLVRARPKKMFVKGSLPMTATVKVVCNVINPKNLPARPGTQFSFTLYHFMGRDQLGIPELVKVQTSDPAPFQGSSAHTQIILNDYDELYDYWVSDFVIDTPGGSGPFMGNWNDEYDVDVPRSDGPFRLFADYLLDRQNLTELNGQLILHQTVT
jgi:hypothetical protein